MKMSHLTRHVKTKHPDHVEKPLQFFQWSFKSCDTQSSSLHNVMIHAQKTQKPPLI